MSRGRTAVPFLSALAVIFCCLAPSAAQAPKTKPIGEEELGRWINKRSDCAPDPPPYFYRLDRHDFKGDGNQEAIVVASTCETGTAGPDVHSVIARDISGELVELKIPETDEKAYGSLFGNRNSDLSVENGLLVSTFEDDAGRATPPLVIKYKWNGKEFQIVSIEKTGVFRTSYDCVKAESDVEKAICHGKELADLDAQLGSLYEALSATMSAADRAALKTEQREGIAKRDKECPIYEGWVECLTESYQKRIDELKKRAAGPARVVPHQLMRRVRQASHRKRCLAFSTFSSTSSAISAGRVSLRLGLSPTFLLSGPTCRLPLTRYASIFSSSNSRNSWMIGWGSFSICA